MYRHRLITTTLFTCGFLLLAFPAHAQLDPNLNLRLQQSPIIVDHNSLYLFDQIPEYYIERAANINMLFSNRSVGVNTDDALTCLTYDYNFTTNNSNAIRAPSRCRSGNSQYPVQESFLDWYRLGGYDRSNWNFGIFASNWLPMTENFITALEVGSISLEDSSGIYHDYIFNDLDVISYQYSYLNINGSDATIDDQPGGLISHNPGDRDDWYDLADLMASLYPNKVFLYMTTSLSRSDGNDTGTNVNNQIRNFTYEVDVLGRHKVLLDFADIESHDDYGNPCYDGLDGYCYCRSPDNCENYSQLPNHPELPWDRCTVDASGTNFCNCNDGINYPAVCPHYTTETLGGHLIGSGKIPVAKGMWVLMAQLAGWDPTGTVTPPPTNPPTPTSSAPTPTTIPLVTGDTDADGDVDLVDFFHVVSSLFSDDLTADLNGDGQVDIFDLNVVVTHFGQ
jgi:hypothetical protein